MKRFQFFVLAAVIVLGLASVLVSAKPAQAQSSSYAVLCIENNTGMKINYLYRWGSGSWNSASLNAGTVDTHSWKYGSGGAYSPNFEIKFDADLTSRTYFRAYDLDRYQSPNQSCRWGKSYAFELSYRGIIDLFAND